MQNRSVMRSSESMRDSGMSLMPVGVGQRWSSVDLERCNEEEEVYIPTDFQAMWSSTFRVVDLGILSIIGECLNLSEFTVRELYLYSLLE